MLFEEIAYGPIHSRRLGISLGMNIMPLHSKLCSFDCIYCECGFNTPTSHPLIPTREEIKQALEQKLRALQLEKIVPDVITFSGNGEPTLHPDFEGIISDTCELRDCYCHSAKVSVLSNSTQLHRPEVVRALLKADNRILKLDSAIDHTMRIIDQPVNSQLTVSRIIELLSQFNGHFTLQTCFLKGDVLTPNPHRPDQFILGHVDNTTPEELEAWYRAVELLHPEMIMIYVIDRKTPVETLSKIDPDTMQAIAAPLRKKGYNISVSC